MVVSCPNLLTSSSETRTAQLGRKFPPGKDSAFAFDGNNGTADVLRSGTQIVGKEKKKVRKKEGGEQSKPEAVK